MTTITIEGCRITMTEETAQAWEREQELYAWENRGRLEWLRNPANFSDEIYSDLFKDEFGFRPHMTLEELSWFFHLG